MLSVLFVKVEINQEQKESTINGVEVSATVKIYFDSVYVQLLQTCCVLSLP
jgi:hypothetical protein